MTAQYVPLPPAMCSSMSETHSPVGPDDCRRRRSDCRPECDALVLVRNWVSKWANRLGCSVCGKCPAPSKTSRRLPGNRW